MITALGQHLLVGSIAKRNTQADINRQAHPLITATDIHMATMANKLVNLFRPGSNNILHIARIVRIA